MAILKLTQQNEIEINFQTCSFVQCMDHLLMIASFYCIEYKKCMAIFSSQEICKLTR